MSLFLNLTNHPSDQWGEEQRKAAEAYGKIIDLPFPVIEPSYDREMVRQMAEFTVFNITSNFTDAMQPVVHIMGEMTYTYAVVSLLKAKGIKCVASTTERDTVMTPDGKKISQFKFVQFREY